MPKPIVSIVLRVNHSGGKRTHHTAVVAPNGRLKPQCGIVAGQPAELPGSSYYLRYRLDGRRVWEAMGSDATTAMQVAKQREIQIKGIKSGLQPAPGTRLHNTMLRQKEKLEVPTPAVEFGCLVRDYAAKVTRRTNNRRTGNQYYRDMTEFGAAVGHKAPADITREDVQLFVHSLQKRGMKPKTIQNRLITLKAFLRHHKMTGEVVNKLDAPVVHKKIPHRYTNAQMFALLAASSFEDKLVWQMFLAAGLREQELSHLGWEDVLFERGLLHLHAKPDLRFRLKDAEERQIPLPTELLLKLQQRRSLRPNDRLVFPTDNGKPDGHLLRRLKDVAFRAGLNCGLCINRAGQSCKLHPVCVKWQLHSFRRTAANRWHEAGLTVPSVQKLLGHSDIETTMLYLTGQDFSSAEFRDSINRSFAAIAA